MTKRDAVRYVAFAASIAYHDALSRGASTQAAEWARTEAFDRAYDEVERWLV